MKRMLFMLTLFTSLLLASCTQQQVGCNDGLVLKDGICVEEEVDNDNVDDNVDDNIDDEEDNVSQTCDVSLDQYGVSNYNLIWNDEFDYEGELDPTKWEYLIGNGGSYGIPGWGNNEKQYYSNSLDNVEVKDGVLRITATTDGYAQYQYTSGRVRTMNKGDFKYGIFEICAQMPTTLGTWPAIWMLPTSSPYGGWPTGGEIDIMEAVGFESNIVHFNIHTENDNWGTSKSIGSKSTISNIGSEYHAYAVKWTEERIVFYVDGIQYFQYTPQSSSYQFWPFDTEFHMILNIAVGGSWGGIQGIQTGDWSDSMFVDYVRVYQE